MELTSKVLINSVLTKQPIMFIDNYVFPKLPKKVCGIYLIYNKISCKAYIGRSSDVRKRVMGHFSKLKKGKHENNHFLFSFNKHGRDAFVPVLLEQCSVKTYEKREQYWLDFFYFDRLYNLIEHSKGGVYAMEKRGKKPLVCYDKSGKVGYYESGADASKKLGLPKGSPARSASKKQHIKGYFFDYPENEEVLKNRVTNVFENFFMIKTKKAVIFIDKKTIILYQKCVDLYVSGLSIKDVDKETGVEYGIVDRLINGKLYPELIDTSKVRPAEHRRSLRKGKYSEKQILEASYLLKKGMKYSDVSKKTGISNGGIEAMAVGKTWGWLTGIKRRKTGTLKGEETTWAKITNDQARDIYLMKGKKSYREIAEQFGTTYAVVANLMKGKSWKHITDNLN